VAHAVDVARLVMEKTPHVMLAAEGAKRFATEQGVLDVPSGRLVTESARKSLEEIKKKKCVSTVTELGYVTEDFYVLY
jgi:isoaspartyl peptidase/L-asparaginase-like protein (Ntn-hydrolase superfamily)